MFVYIFFNNSRSHKHKSGRERDIFVKIIQLSILKNVKSNQQRQTNVNSKIGLKLYNIVWFYDGNTKYGRNSNQIRCDGSQIK